MIFVTPADLERAGMSRVIWNACRNGQTTNNAFSLHGTCHLLCEIYDYVPSRRASWTVTSSGRRTASAFRLHLKHTRGIAVLLNDVR
jgi:hypothetical protein